MWLINFFRSSVKVKFTTLFLLGAFIPMFIMIISIYSKSRDLLQKKEVEYVTNEMNILTDKLSDNITGIKKNMTGILLRANILDETNKVHYTPYERYIAGVRVNEILSSLSAYDTTEQSYAFVSCKGSTYDNGTSVNIFLSIDDELIQSIIEKGPEWTITTRNLFTIIPVPAITIGRPVYYKGSLIGALIADIKYSSLDTIIKQGTSQNNNIYLFDEKGKLIYSYGSSDLVAHLSSVDLVNGSVVENNDERYLCVKNLSAQDGYTSIALIPETKMFRDLSDFNLHSHVIILVMLIESLLFAGFVSNTVSRNIIALSKAVEEFTENSKPVRIGIRSADEIGRLNKGIEMMTSRIPELLKQVSERETEKRHLEIKALMSQINPHMIYNTLNSITYLAQTLGISNIEEVSSSFSHLLRITASIPGEFLSIRQEVDYIRYYTNIKKYDLLFPLCTDIHVEEELMNCQIPKLVLQPFIENSIIHGFRNYCQEGKILVRIKRNGEMMHICISDNGCGISEEKINELFLPEVEQEYKKIGVSNTMKRLKLYYGNRSMIDVQSDGRTYTTVLIDIPMKLEEDTMNFE